MKKEVIKILTFLFPFALIGQTMQEKQVNHQMQTWVSVNTVTKFNEHWGIIADFHERWDDFFKDNDFYFVRGGIGYYPNSKVSFAGGYTHTWKAPSIPNWSTYSNENRIYQQFQINVKLGNVAVSHRLRNEQIWQEKVINDIVLDDIRFTDRVRYAISFTIPVFNKSTLPVLVLSEEIMVHFGDEVVYNTFDQNRFFVGIKQSLNSHWSYDFGYMNIYQQKYSGYQYDMNHTLRLFFYLKTSLKTKGHNIPHSSGDE
jgi:hypothetical protein